MTTRAETLERISAIFGWIAEVRITLHIDTSFPLADAPEAHRQLENLQTTGKLLLVP
jgi:NADPH:quinone reductase